MDDAERGATAQSSAAGRGSTVGNPTGTSSIEVAEPRPRCVPTPEGGSGVRPADTGRPEPGPQDADPARTSLVSTSPERTEPVAVARGSAQAPAEPDLEEAGPTESGAPEFGPTGAGTAEPEVSAAAEFHARDEAADGDEPDEATACNVTPTREAPAAARDDPAPAEPAPAEPALADPVQRSGRDSIEATSSARGATGGRGDGRAVVADVRTVSPKDPDEHARPTGDAGAGRDDGETTVDPPVNTEPDPDDPDTNDGTAPDPDDTAESRPVAGNPDGAHTADSAADPTTDAVATAALVIRSRTDDDLEVADQPAAEPSARRRRRWPAWVELPVLIALGLAVVMLVHTFVAQPFVIPSGSMENTLKVGDRVLVNEFAYRFGDVRRGDVIVFDGKDSFTPEGGSSGSSNPVMNLLHRTGALFGLSSSNETDFVKRVIGVGGDHVVCCDAQGRITVNDVALDEGSYLKPGVSPSDQPFDVVVPRGKLWVMGDNRADSADSRSHLGDPGGGFVPTDRVIGRVQWIIWPLGRLQGVDRPKTFSQPGIDRQRPAAGAGR